MPTEPVSVRLDGVSRVFGGVTALHPTDLDIAAGEFVSLLGPSGCGKTTTLRLIAGFDAPDTGHIRIGGRDVTALPPDRRHLGMVFQNYALFPHMTVAKNIAFGLRMARMGRAEIETRVRRMLDMVHLPGHGDRFPSQLSGGQQQRVAIARSLVTEPSVLLLDEPMAALDKNLRQSMQSELRQIQQNLGVTTVLVTHDQEEALTMSDTIVVMRGGRVLQVGSPGGVYNHPRSRFVSEFLGASNLLPAKVTSVGADGTLALRLSVGGSNGVTITARGEAAAGDDVVLGVRPECISIHPEPTRDSGRVGLPGTVSGLVFRGAFRSYTVAAEDRDFVVYEQADSGREAPNWSSGQRVWLSWAEINQSVFADA